MHSLTCMSVVVCVVRKPRPCNSYSRRRDRINSVLRRSYYKGGGGVIQGIARKAQKWHERHEWQGSGGPVSHAASGPKCWQKQNPRAQLYAGDMSPPILALKGMKRRRRSPLLKCYATAARAIVD